MPFLLRCAFSCVSSAPSTVCRSNYIACRQKVSHQCVGLQILGASVRVAALQCTACMQRAFLQCVWACGSSDHQFEHNNSYTGYIWKASLLNGSACVSWGKRLLCRRIHTVCSWRGFPPNGFEWLFSWMCEQLSMCLLRGPVFFAGVVKLFANKRPFSWMS